MKEIRRFEELMNAKENISLKDAAHFTGHTELLKKNPAMT